MTNRDLANVAAVLLASSRNASYTAASAVKDARLIAAEVERDLWMDSIEKDVSGLPFPRIEDVHGFARPEPVSGVEEDEC